MTRFTVITFSTLRALGRVARQHAESSYFPRRRLRIEYARKAR